MKKLELNIEALRDMGAQIAAIDEKLDAASDTASAGKRAIANRLVTENEQTINSIVSQFREALANVDADTLAGVFTGITRELNSEFKEKVDAHLTSLAESNTSTVEVPSEEELTALQEERKKKVGLFKALVELLDGLGVDVSVVPAPKKRTGSRGKRGPRVMSQFQFFWNGEALSAADNSLATIAKRVPAFVDVTETLEDGSTKKVSPAKALRDFISSEENFGEDALDLKNPSDEWAFVLPSGDELSARRIEAADADDEDEETDPDNEDED